MIRAAPPLGNANGHWAVAVGAQTEQQAQSNHSLEPSAVQGSKSLSVWLYCIGARSSEATSSAFSAHPEWRHA